MKCASCKKKITRKPHGTAAKLSMKFCNRECQRTYAKGKNYYFKRKKKGQKHQPYMEEFERQIEEIEFQNTLSRLYEI